MRIDVSTTLCGLFTAVVLHTCLQIEVWNCLAGGVLPHKECGKIRVSMVTSETQWREMMWMATHDAAWTNGRPLSSDERERMVASIRNANRRNAVKYWADN